MLGSRKSSMCGQLLLLVISIIGPAGGSVICWWLVWGRCSVALWFGCIHSPLSLGQLPTAATSAKFVFLLVLRAVFMCQPFLDKPLSNAEPAFGLDSDTGSGCVCLASQFSCVAEPEEKTPYHIRESQ